MHWIHLRPFSREVHVYLWFERTRRSAPLTLGGRRGGAPFERDRETQYPPQLDERRYFSEALPTIAEAYRAALAGRPVNEQHLIQAAAERRGAAFWRALASSVADGSARETLRRCAELEELSAEFLEALVSRNA